MVLAPASIADRRRFTRRERRLRCALTLEEPRRSLDTEGLNISGGGLCLRLNEMLEVRSLVGMRLMLRRGRAGSGPAAIRCKGRVIWIVQRLDLRPAPPFLFDAGIEFIDPPRIVRRLLMPSGARRRPGPASPASGTGLLPAIIRGRPFEPRLERTGGRPFAWHLVVSVEGVPCFSEHSRSKRAALATWLRFKRRAARRRGEGAPWVR